MMIMLKEQFSALHLTNDVTEAVLCEVIGLFIGAAYTRVVQISIHRAPSPPPKQ